MSLEHSSKTAETTNAIRSLGTIAENTSLFHDPVARAIVSPGWHRLGKTRLRRWLFCEQLLNRLYPGGIGMVLIRSRFADELLTRRATEGWRQCVVLGAGFDTTGVRRADLVDRVRVFELDHPLSQREKTRRLAQHGIAVPANVTLVPIDFEEESLRAALADTAFDPTEPTLVSWLGVAYYLAAGTVERTFAELRELCASGSDVVFDYLDADALQEPSRFKSARRVRRFVRRLGEPLISGLEPAELEPLLRQWGFELLEHHLGPAQRELFPDAELGPYGPSEYFHLAVARKR